jgi:hypothetical protein
MGFLDRFKPKPLWSDMLPGDRRLLDLLTAGDAPALAKLRAQWGEPFWLGVDRPTMHKNRYEIALVYDGSAVDRHSIGEDINVQIDDLFVLDRRLGDALPCVGYVSGGVLSSIIVSAPEARRWPREFSVDDWEYAGAGGARGKTRVVDWTARIAGAAKAPQIDPVVDAAIPADYRTYVSSPDRVMEIHDATILRLGQMYFLDDDRVDRRLLVFASCADASVFAFDSDGRVCFVDVSDGTAEQRAGSFSQWRLQEDE